MGVSPGPRQGLEGSVLHVPSLGRLLLLLASAGLGELGLHPLCLEPRQGLLRAESPGRSPGRQPHWGGGEGLVWRWLGQGVTLPLYP